MSRAVSEVVVFLVRFVFLVLLCFVVMLLAVFCLFCLVNVGSMQDQPGLFFI